MIAGTYDAACGFSARGTSWYHLSQDFPAASHFAIMVTYF